MNIFAKELIKITKAAIKVHFPYAVFTYKTSTTDGVTTLTINFEGELDIHHFQDMLELNETDYLKFAYKGKMFQLI